VGINRAFQLREHVSIVPSFNDATKFATLLQTINILPKKKRWVCFGFPFFFPLPNGEREREKDRHTLERQIYLF
jgi:hypothetical protein